MLGEASVVSEAQKQFDQAFAPYRATLIPLYKRKSKLVAQREALRFQYLTGARTKIDALFSAIINKAFTESSAVLWPAVNAVVGSIKILLPMSDLKGAPLQGWATILVGAAWNDDMSYMSLLAPTESWLKTNPHGLKNYVSAQFYDLSYYTQYTQGLSLYGFQSSPVPVTKKVVEQSLQNNGLSLTGEQIDYVVQLFGQAWNGVTLTSAVDEAKDLYGKLVSTLFDIIAVQKSIDEAEKNLADLVEAFKSQIPDLMSLDQLLQSIKDDALKEEQAVAAPAEPKSNKLWWAAAAAAVFFVTKQE